MRLVAANRDFQREPQQQAAQFGIDLCVSSGREPSKRPVQAVLVALAFGGSITEVSTISSWTLVDCTLPTCWRSGFLFDSHLFRFVQQITHFPQAVRTYLSESILPAVQQRSLDSQFPGQLRNALPSLDRSHGRRLELAREDSAHSPVLFPGELFQILTSYRASLMGAAPVP